VFSLLERLRRTVGSFPIEVGSYKAEFWKINFCNRLDADHDAVTPLLIFCSR